MMKHKKVTTITIIFIFMAAFIYILTKTNLLFRSKAPENSVPEKITAKGDELTKEDSIKDITGEQQNSINNDLTRKHDDIEGISAKYENPDNSCVVTLLPWENDEDFKAEKEKYGAKVLMSAYCAVLNDPLPGEEENVHVGSKLLCGAVIEPNKVFSQNKTIGPYVKERGYLEGPTYAGTKVTTTIGGGVCKIASVLYNLAVMGNLQIIERHAHNMPVSYVPYGQDATVYYGVMDFRFKNTTDSSLLIWSRAIGNKLYIGLYGKSIPPKVTWNHQVLNTVKTKEIYTVNTALKPNEVRTLVIGMDGATINSWVTIENPDGTVIKKQLGKSEYKPLPYLLEKGT